MPSLFSGCRDGTHPLAVGPVNPGLFPGQADQTGSAGGCHENLGPADRSFRRTTRAASADSEVRPGPRPPTLTPHQVKAREAGPEALPTSSLPTRRSLQLGEIAVANGTVLPVQFTLTCGPYPSL